MDFSDLKRQAWMGNLPTLREFYIILGMTDEQAAAACLVSPETFRRWRRDRQPNPTAQRLLAILAGHVPWAGWDGWEVQNGCLFPPGYDRHGLRPGDVLAMPFTLQLLADYRRQVEQLRSASLQTLEPKTSCDS